jgi:phosphoribosylaminoimidazolecarboxamide formyltransferase/IMP cyclohydrolase
MAELNAFMSLSYKEGVVEFARALVDRGFTLYSSGGTGEKLRAGGLVVTDISEIIKRSMAKIVSDALKQAGVSLTEDEMVKLLAGVGRPILGHRVVTLSREYHAALLAKMTDADAAELAELGIPYMHLVNVGFYDLNKALRQYREGEISADDVIESTDIGGPTMARSAAKGHRIIICDNEQRTRVLQWLDAGRPNENKFLFQLASEAELEVGRYCARSGEFLLRQMALS